MKRGIMGLYGGFCSVLHNRGLRLWSFLSQVPALQLPQVASAPEQSHARTLFGVGLVGHRGQWTTQTRVSSLQGSSVANSTGVDLQNLPC